MSSFFITQMEERTIMGIVRIEKTKNYTVMSNYHLRDKSLSLKAKGLMSLMLSLPDDWDYSVAGLVTQVKEERTAVSSAINELIEHGYMTREVVRENGRISDWNYTVYETPTESVLPSENLIVENLMLENHTQLNTDINQIKTKKSTGAGASSKNHSQVYKQRTTLSDDLESGKDIDEQKKSKKKSPKDKFRDECLDIIDDEYSEKNYSYTAKDLLVEYFEFVSAVPENKDNLCKRVKTTKMWKNKLVRLDELVKDGYDPIDIIQQSLDNKAYVFYPLQSTQQKSNKHKEGNQENVVMSDPEYMRKRLEEDESEEWY